MDQFDIPKMWRPVFFFQNISTTNNLLVAKNRHRNASGSYNIATLVQLMLSLKNVVKIGYFLFRICPRDKYRTE